MRALYSIVFLLAFQTSLACEITDEIFKSSKGEDFSIDHYIDIYNIEPTPELAFENLKIKLNKASSENHLLLSKGECNGISWKLIFHLHQVVLGDDSHGLVLTVSTYDKSGTIIDKLPLASVLSYEEQAIERTSRKLIGNMLSVCEQYVQIYQHIDSEESIEYFTSPIKSTCKTQYHSFANGRFKNLNP
ncbi:hypothetical protein AAFN46_18740 [Pseudomonas sp. CAU 1711]|uniref:hypothetical protein n=1 Tax=Pseudomonas sp. CAU 1711 TaxID=3140356 RepID=UPI003260B71D